MRSKSKKNPAKAKAAKRKRKAEIVPFAPRPKRAAKQAQFVPGAKILFFDIESTGLTADWASVLCISWKWIDEKRVHTVTILDSPTYATDPTNDKWLLEQFERVYEQADAVVAHFGFIFDLRFLNTRRLLYELSPLPKAAFLDTWYFAKKHLALKSNRLASIADYFGLEEKTPLKGSIWRAAAAGDRKAHAHIIEHCEQDIRVLEQVYYRLRPIMWNHANMNLAAGAPLLQPAGNCPKCGSYRLQRRGRYVTRTRVQVRMQCISCGGWHLLPPQKPIAVRIDDAFAKREVAA